jgi:hypothetical protein
MRTKTAYKLTTQAMTTHNDCQWKLNEPKQTSGEGDLCGPGWLHVYSDPLLAVLLNPIHAGIKNPRLFKCRVSGETKNDAGLKQGWTKVVLVKELSLPQVTSIQRIAFGILCSLQSYKRPAYVEWTKNWLSGKDRSAAAARAEAEAAARAARAAAWAARAAWAAWAAWAAAWAADKPINLIKLAKQAMTIK